MAKNVSWNKMLLSYLLLLLFVYLFFRLYWDLIILALLIVNMFLLPLAIAFFIDDMSSRWVAVNLASDGILLLDIVLNFKTGVLVHGTPNIFILDPKKIAMR